MTPGVRVMLSLVGADRTLPGERMCWCDRPEKHHLDIQQCSRSARLETEPHVAIATAQKPPKKRSI